MTHETRTATQANPQDLESLIHEVIGAALNVHKALGCGYLERFYENALCIELDRMGLPVDRQLDVPVLYQDVEVGVHRLDLVVQDRLIVELKAVRMVDAVHYAVLRSYLKATGFSLGLIVNFGLQRLDVRRVVPRSEGSA